MMKDTITWSLNTITQKQFKNNPAKEVEHVGPLEEVLDKLLPSMGRTDIPSHLIAIIKHYGHGVLELPGTQRWDCLRLYYRCDKADLILDYDAHKSDLSVTKIRPDGGISIDSVSEMKVPQEWYEEEKVENKELKTGFLQMNEQLGINGGVRRGDLTAIPNRWMGESEINPEAIVDYPSLAGERGGDETTVNDLLEIAGELAEIPTPAEVVDQSGLYALANGYSHDPLDQASPRDENAINQEIELRRTLRRARDLNNVRIGALGEPVGSIEEVKKAKDALKDFLDERVVGKLRTADQAELIFANYSHNEATMFNVLKGRQQAAGANSDFDGDQMHGPAISPYRQIEWRTRNPAYQAFFKEGKAFYDHDFKPITVLKTNYEDYVLLVKLLRREIYNSDSFLSPALFISALYKFPHIVRADRRTAMRLINKAYRSCVSRYFRPWFQKSIWEYKDRVIRMMMMDGSKREFLGRAPGMFRRSLKNDIRACPTLTRQCMTGGETEHGR